MSTPVHVFVELAARHGGVDPDDVASVQRWYLEELPKLPVATIRALIDELVARDGEPGKPTVVKAYPRSAALPSLSDSPPAPLLPPGYLQRFLRRLFGKRA